MLDIDDFAVAIHAKPEVGQQVVIILRPTDRAPQIFTALHMGRSASFRASWRGSQREPESRNFKDFWMLAFAGMTQRRSRNSLTNLCDAQISQRISENSTLVRLHRNYLRQEIELRQCSILKKIKIANAATLLSTPA